MSLNQYDRMFSPSHLNLTWTNVSVTIGNQKTQPCLQNVTGYARAARILALIGPSSSGKSTLITLLSGRHLSNKVVLDTSTSRIYLMGHPINDRRILLEQCGYVESPTQFKSSTSSITVREHLVFQVSFFTRTSATDHQQLSQVMLRAPSNVDTLHRYSLIQLLLKRLDLHRCENTFTNQLSGGEARRLCLVSCLLSSPSIILFDDCNTGLDSHLALSLIRHIRSLRKTTILVLHQPSSRMMSLIDDVCLFGPCGRVIYMGPADQALSVFQSLCPSHVNAADFFLEQAVLIKDDGDNIVARGRWESILIEQWALIDKDNEKQPMVKRLRSSYEASFFVQMRWLFWRSLSLRETHRLAILLSQLLILALICGVLDLGVGRHEIDQRTVQNTSGLLIRMMILIIRTSCLLALATTSVDHNTLRLESYHQRLYSIGAYYLTKTLSELPVFILMTWLFINIVFVLAGLQNYFVLCLVMILTTLCGIALSSLLASIVRTKETRLVFWHSFTQSIAMLSGFYINARSIPLILRPVRLLSF